VIVDIEFNLQDKVLNPKKETKKIHFEAKGRNIVVLGNGDIKRYWSFQMKM